jgi:glucose/mannose-6-phosphate isomerase
METLIRTFPQQLIEATRIAAAWQPAHTGFRPTSVAVLGLGGSAFGGEIVRNTLRDELPLPFTIYRSYELPACVGKDTLVLACSYSGNTEETLTAATEAQTRGARLVCITGGGKLAEMARTHGHDLLLIPGGQPPRTACGYSLTVQLHVLHRYGLIANPQPALDAAHAVMTSFTEAEHAQVRALAQRLSGTVPIIYSTDTADSVAIRLRQQINENAKQLCWHHTLPEMNHNELVGWVHPAGFLEQMAHVLLLTTSYEHPRNQVRISINREILLRALPSADRLTEVQARGEGKLAQLLYLLHWADWLSLYLAQANGADPIPVQVIDYLKGELEKAH